MSGKQEEKTETGFRRLVTTTVWSAGETRRSRKKMDKRLSKGEKRKSRTMINVASSQSSSSLGREARSEEDPEDL